MSTRLQALSNYATLLTRIFLDVTKNVFYWSRVAIVVAQGSGMHRRLVGLNKECMFVRCSNFHSRIVWKALSSAALTKGYGNGFGGRSSREIALLLLLLGDQ